MGLGLGSGRAHSLLPRECGYEGASTLSDERWAYIYISMMADGAFETRWLDAGSSMGVHASCGSTVTTGKVGKIYLGVASGLVYHLNRRRMAQSGCWWERPDLVAACSVQHSVA